MHYKTYKTILSPQNGMNLYRGCTHGCIYSVSYTHLMHDSYTPLGGMVTMLLMQLGEVIFGGTGCGLYGMLAFAILTVFLAGLMVGRTPEYLGKKIEPYEMKMAVIACLATPFAILVGSGIAALVPAVADLSLIHI